MHPNLLTLVATVLVGKAAAQQVGTYTTETHPRMTWQRCSSGGSCTSVNGELVIDSNWRWVHDKNGYTNCYTGNEWNSTICADKNGDALTLKFVTKGSYSTNIGSRLYLMSGSEKYQMFTLLGNEFSFDVDVSKLGCGLNGALYFVSMDEDGGKSKYSSNKAGAKYGTANVAGWKPSSNDENAGVGNYGSCCSEMDVCEKEANSVSTAYSPHPCTTVGQHRCQGDSRGGTYSGDRYGGTCDPDGCDFNAYRQGVKNFYGPGMTVDTKKKFTVVTQFIKGSDGNLAEIKRFYVQNGKTIANPSSTIPGNTGNSITPEFCRTQKTAFGDRDIFNARGGFPQMSKALAAPMVLVMSVWDDHHANMLWLDSTYPVDADPNVPGKARGTCSTSSGVPKDVESSQANDQVIFSNIKFGPIGSTFKQ
ncbi:hypothetical protein VTG60DRAFT_5104 [Thermothelomyces hinnuleus]